MGSISSSAYEYPAVGQFVMPTKSLVLLSKWMLCLRHENNSIAYSEIETTICRYYTFWLKGHSVIRAKSFLKVCGEYFRRKPIFPVETLNFSAFSIYGTCLTMCLDGMSQARCTAISPAAESWDLLRAALPVPFSHAWHGILFTGAAFILSTPR